jgi:hypothetical protein
VQPPIHTVDLSSLITEIEHHRQEHQPHDAASSFNQASWLHLIMFFIAIGIFLGALSCFLCDYLWLISCHNRF